MLFTRKKTTAKLIEASEKLSAAILKFENGELAAGSVFLGQANKLLAQAKEEL